ncbi:MAG TPA: PEP-CTERM sorting domain-containing protein, partial [Steroidobacter sp.]|nr:PEP-CTERM sorting domain-containing protein [Steroidobacter sp.]
GQSGLLEIWGGQFGYAGAGQGLMIDDLMDFSVYGRDLVYSNGWLTGYLMDGSWFSNALTFGSRWQGTFTIHNVPEPETLGLLLAGLLGMTVRRRKRH